MKEFFEINEIKEKEFNIPENSLRKILLDFIPSNEIKSRFKNKQLKINNEVVTDLNIELNVIGKPISLGDFIFNNLNTNLAKLLKVVNVRDFFGDGEETNLNHLKFLKGYTLITLSKKEEYVFKNNN